MFLIIMKNLHNVTLQVVDDFECCFLMGCRNESGVYLVNALLVSSPTYFMTVFIHM